jgi:hypothetical protein
MADGRWPMADGRWPMADGRWPMKPALSLEFRYSIRRAWENSLAIRITYDNKNHPAKAAVVRRSHNTFHSAG